MTQSKETRRGHRNGEIEPTRVETLVAVLAYYYRRTGSAIGTKFYELRTRAANGYIWPLHLSEEAFEGLDMDDVSEHPGDYEYVVEFDQPWQNGMVKSTRDYVRKRVSAAATDVTVA